jgi:nitroreductase
VVLLEAGHIAQNILLAATARGLASAPTCAITDRVAERLCGLDPVTQAAVYAVAVGPRSALRSRADMTEIAPNPHLP